MTTTNPTLVFTTEWHWFSLLVNIGTTSPVSHVAIGLGDHLLHAQDDGVVFEPRSAWLNRGKRHVAEIEIVPDVSDGLQRCASQIGQPFNHAGIVKTGLWILLQRMYSPMQFAKPSHGNGYTCAGFVMLLDPDGERIPEWRQLQRSIVTPAELLGVAQQSFRKVG